MRRSSENESQEGRAEERCRRDRPDGKRFKPKYGEMQRQQDRDIAIGESTQRSAEQDPLPISSRSHPRERPALAPRALLFC
ncbi:MAG: hypothetical protein K0R41_2217 [Geminicoccaceae bacterium]|nr:hypothetical protein [Geminicoccaceae bacterium]